MKTKQILLCLLALFVSISAQALSFEVDGIKYTTTEGGVTVTGYNSTATNLVLNGSVTYQDVEYNVVSIGNNAFYGCSSLTSVGDLSACTSIGYQAFYNCSNLTSVGDLSACTSIGGSAFSGCSSLTSVDLSACTSIGGGAFSGCSSLTSVDLSACTSIGGGAFSGCSSLTSVDLSACTSLGGGAFSGCSSLTSVGDMSACTSIGDYAFQDCSSLTSVGDLSACTSIGESAFSRCENLVSVGDLSACKSIGKWAFSDNYMYSSSPYLYCKKLTIIGNLGATSIEECAFNGCSSLTSVGDMSACTSIGNQAFQDCSSLTSVGDLSACTSIGVYAFEGCSSLTSVGDLSACTSIGNQTFYNCSNLASVGDLSACTSIGNQTFYNCSSLASVGDLSACTSIGNQAFYNCSSLASVGDLNSCNSIGNQAFTNCTKLEEIVLSGSAVASLPSLDALTKNIIVLVPAPVLAEYKSADVWKEMAFRIFAIGDEPQRYFTFSTTAQDNYSGITDMIADEILPVVYSLNLSGTINSYDLFTIRNKMPGLRYLDLTNATVVGSSFEYYSGCHTDDNDLGISCFRELNLISVKLPKTISKVGDYVFYNCRYLDVVTIPTGVSSIGRYSFAGCSALTSVPLPKTVVTIDVCAFQNCSSLSSVNIPTGVTTISNYTFDGCSALSSISLPKTVKTIGTYAFRNCSSLPSVTLPAALTSTGDYSFLGCSGLQAVHISDWDAYCRISFGWYTPLYYAHHLYLNGEEVTGEITLPSDIIKVSNAAFEGCESITSVIIPEGVTSIGASSFRSCTNLVSVHLPSTVKNFGETIFTSCTKLTDIWNDALVPQGIGNNVFDAANYNMATLHVPNASKYAYQYDSTWSKFLKVEGNDVTFGQWVVNNMTDFVVSDQSMISTTADAKGEIDAGSAFIANNTKQDIKMGEIVIYDNGTRGGSFISNGHATADKLTYAISVNARKWYFLTFPGRVKLSDVSCEGSWVLRYYDGAIRAENGSGGWQNLPEGTEYLEPGQGYIFQCNQAGTLTVTVDNAYAGQDGTDKNLTLTAHAAEQIQHASWNYLGNPFTSYYSIADMGYSSPITVWTGSSYQAVRAGDDVYHLRPFQAFFVQKPENVQSISFLADSRKSYNMTQAAQNSKDVMLARKNGKEERLFVNLTLSNGADADQTRVVFNDKKWNTYELDCDASKFLTGGMPQLYTLDADRVAYAINERQTGTVAVGFVAPVAGTYTLEAVRMDKPMLLEDKQLGITFDLANGAYEFESAAGTFDNRFMLVENGSATGISESVAQQGVRVSATEGGLFVGGLQGQTVSIYSIDGKLVGKSQSDGIVALQRGTYVVSVGGTKTKVMVK